MGSAFFAFFCLFWVPHHVLCDENQDLHWVLLHETQQLLSFDELKKIDTLLEENEKISGRKTKFVVTSNFQREQLQEEEKDDANKIVTRAPVPSITFIIFDPTRNQFSVSPGWEDEELAKNSTIQKALRSINRKIQKNFAFKDFTNFLYIIFDVEKNPLISEYQNAKNPTPTDDFESTNSLLNPDELNTLENFPLPWFLFLIVLSGFIFLLIIFEALNKETIYTSSGATPVRFFPLLGSYLLRRSFQVLNSQASLKKTPHPHWPEFLSKIMETKKYALHLYLRKFPFSLSKWVLKKKLAHEYPKSFFIEINMKPKKITIQKIPKKGRLNHTQIELEKNQLRTLQERIGETHYENAINEFLKSLL